MSKMIQIRNVPDPVHRELKARAARLGLSLSDFLLREITPLAELPSIEELMERIARRSPVELEETPTETVRRWRDQM
jgi:plasmid stability protein